MHPRITALLALFALLIVAGCGNQAAPATTAAGEANAPAAPAPVASAPTATPDDVAREFVTALGSWEELTLRRLALPGSENEMRINGERGQWRRWTEDRLGPQRGVEVSESSVDGDLALVVVRSTHEKGDSGVKLTMVRQDGVWKVESWDSYRL